MKIPFRDGAFDVVIDKGTYDAIQCGGNSDAALIQEMYRVCSGTVFLVSHEPPARRFDYFRETVSEAVVEPHRC